MRKKKKSINLKIPAMRRCGRFTLMAEGRGIEPQFTGPEPVVLPLDDPSIHKLQSGEATIYIKKMSSQHGAWDDSWHIYVNC